MLKTMRNIKSINQHRSTWKRSSLIIIALVTISLLVLGGWRFRALSRIDSIYTFSRRASSTPIPTRRIKYKADNQSLRCIVHSYGNGGRLGNQMFIIAAAYGLARLHSCHLYIATDPFTQMNTSFLLDIAPLLISTKMFSTIVNDTSQSINQTSLSTVCEYFPEMTRPNAIPSGSILTLRGYWQSYLHFIKYADDFRQRIFVPTPPILRTVSQFFARIHKDKFADRTPLSSTDYHALKRQLASVDRCNMDRYSCATHGLRRHVIRVVRCLSVQGDCSFYRPVSRCALHRGER